MVCADIPRLLIEIRLTFETRLVLEEMQSQSPGLYQETRLVYETRLLLEKIRYSTCVRTINII